MRHLGKYLLLLILLLLGLISFFIGPSGFCFKDLSVPLKIRLPRIILGIYAGGVLSMVGAALQGLFQNPLVDPYILGISGGASLGVVLGHLLGRAGIYTIPLFSFICATITIFLVYSIAQARGQITRLTLVLAGVILSFFFNSLVILFMVFSKKPLSEIIYFLMGHLNLIFTKELLIVFVGILVVTFLLLIYLFSLWRPLNIMQTNFEVQESLGVNTTQLTKRVFFVSSFLVAAVISFVGVISFIGLCVPHIVRLFYGPDHYKLLPYSFIIGAGVLLVTDLLARTITPVELPLSVLTALLGVPFFIYLLKKNL
jgi:iron complex transport system permease protein